ncbi:MAG: YHS domain-containing (seleno)protein, partial [Chitinophagales bacterium]
NKFNLAYIWLFLFCLLLSFFSISLFANNDPNSTTLYIVRHAETQSPLKGDLSPTGKQRAKDLSTALQTKTLHAIYTSHKMPDKETAKIVAKNKRLFINTYDAKNMSAFQARILKQRKGQNVLIVGSLETITLLLQDLSTSFSTASINPNQFNTMYEVQISADNSTNITQVQYSELGTIIGPAGAPPMDYQTQSDEKQDFLEFTNNSTPNNSLSPVSVSDIVISKPEEVSITTTDLSQNTPPSNSKVEKTSVISSNSVKEKEEQKLPSLLKTFNLTKKGIVLLGYDVVAYFKNEKAIKGEEKFATVYRDATFHFSNRKNLNTFKENPESYLPKYGGWCALGMSIEGMKDGYKADKYAADPENFKIIGGELYVFYKTLDYDGLTKWNEEADEAACIKRADKFWEKSIIR